MSTPNGRRRPSKEEGFRIARPLLVGIPHKISLDSEGEYEAMSKLLAALLSPPMGEPSPERLQMYIEFSKSSAVYSDALRRYHEELDNPRQDHPPPGPQVAAEGCWQASSAALRQDKSPAP